MAVTFNPFKARSLDFMGEEIADPRLVPNEDVEMVLRKLGEECPEKKELFDGCIEFLHENWDLLNSMTLEENMALLDQML